MPDLTTPTDTQSGREVEQALVAWQEKVRLADAQAATLPEGEPTRSLQVALNMLTRPTIPIYLSQLRDDMQYGEFNTKALNRYANEILTAFDDTLAACGG